MKKFGLILLLIFIAVVFCACAKNSVTIVEEESYYSDYCVENDVVYINCILTVNSSKDQTVSFVGDFETDAETGLLTEETLKTSAFDIKKGRQSIDVTFVGDFGGTNKKANRKLPDITIVTGEF